MAIHRFNFPTVIQFGPGASAMASQHLAERGLRAPLVVTDRGIAPLPVAKRFVESLSSLNPTVFAGIWGNPVKSQVLAGVDAYRSARADSIIGFGGGAALDVAKAIALMVHHPGDLFDYEDDLPGARPVDQKIPYFVALPTTSGTGSEVGRSAVVSDDATHAKKIIFSPRLLAQAVFADPELTLDLPANVTAWTGMDALTHCVEAFLAKAYHPICDGIALEGLRLAAGALAKAVSSPRDLEARADMMLASMMGAIAFQKGLGITHSCAHALSTVADFHHGFANGVMIDHAIRYNLPTSEDRFRRACQAVGIAGGGKEFLGWLADLKKRVGIPAGLAAAGLSDARSKISRLVEVASKDACHPSNPRPCTPASFEEVFSAAL